MAKQLLKKYPKYQKKVFDSLITGFIFMSPSGKLIARDGHWNMPKGQILLSEHWQQRRCYTPFSLEILGHLCILLLKKLAVCLIASIRMWFWKKLRTKMRKVRPNTGLQYVHLLYDNAPAYKSSTVAQFLKSERVNVALQTRPGPLRVFPFSEIEKKKKTTTKNTYLVGGIGPEVHWSLQFTSFYWVYPKMSMKSFFFQNWIKRLKRCVLAKRDYFKGD